MSYSTASIILGGYSQTLAASQTGVVVSEARSISSKDALALAIAVNVTGFTGTATLSLQHSSDGVNWSDVDASMTFNVAATGVTRKSINVQGVAAAMPLFPKIRLVATTAVTSSLSIKDILVTSAT